VANVKEGSPEMIGKPEFTNAECRKQCCDSEMIDEHTVESPVVAHTVENDRHSMVDLRKIFLKRGKLSQQAPIRLYLH